MLTISLLERISLVLAAEGEALNVDTIRASITPELWTAVCKRLGVGPEHPFQYLGSGKRGSAYKLTGGTVVKFTTDSTEAEASASLMGKKLRHIATYEDVFRFAVRNGHVFAIKQEELKKGDQDWKDSGEIATFYFHEVLDKQPFTPLAVDQFRQWADKRFGRGTVTADDETKVSRVSRDSGRKGTPERKEPDSKKLFKEKDPDKPFGDWVRKGAKMPNPDFFKWFEGLCGELTSNGIEFYDLNGGNMMKRGTEHVVTDLGQSLTASVPKIDDVSAMLDAAARNIRRR